MAKYKLTILDIVSIVGNVGPVTFTARGPTPVFRKRYPNKTLTPAQKIMTVAFARADAHWRDLSLVDRQAWRAYRAWQKINGYSQYMRINITRYRDDLPPIDNPAMIP